MILSLPQYTAQDICRICADTSLQGAVLGDLFCQKRMFAGGEAEMLHYMEQLKSHGKAVYFQTPAYLADPLLDKTLQTIAFLQQEHLLDAVLLQDVGLLYQLSTQENTPPLIWSFMGLTRNQAVSAPNLAFLKSLHPITIATDKASGIPEFIKNDIDVMLMYGCPVYQTVNRSCYYTYETDCSILDCGRRCLKNDYRLASHLANLSMSLDGHMLGLKLRYEPAERVRAALPQTHHPLLVYAENILSFRQKIQTFEEVTL